jgi:hypothetical protein
LTIDGVEYAIDSNGIASVHFGSKLPEAAYVATVPDLATNAKPQILLAAAASDNARFGGQLLGNRAVVYALGERGIEPFSFNISGVNNPLDIGFGRFLEVRVKSELRHELLGVESTTAIGEAWLIKKGFFGGEEKRSLGQVIIDLRGTRFLSPFVN